MIFLHCIGIRNVYKHVLHACNISSVVWTIYIWILLGIRKDVHEEFVKRMEEEDNRQNHRITKLELAIESISSIATSVERLATNMEHMVREQARQGENINDQSERISKLESRDGEMWRKVVSHIVISAISIIIGYIACKLGLQ